MQEDVFPRAQGCAPEEPAPGGAEPEPLPPAQAEQMVQLGGVTAAKGRMRSFDYENPYLTIQKYTGRLIDSL